MSRSCHRHEARDCLPAASIILLAFNRSDLTRRCLATLRESLGEALGGRFELVLVNNGSTDDTAQLFETWRDAARIVTLHPNRHYAGGMNAGARAASGNVLVFLSNDVEVVPGSLETLAAEALDPSVGMVGVRLLYHDGTIQHAGVALRRRESGDLINFHLFHGEAGDHPAARSCYDVGAVTAAAFAMRREVFLSLGGFDEAYVNGWEDMDLCMRVRAAGLRVVYRGDVHLVHGEAQTVGVGTHDASGNRARFFSRWSDLLQDDAVTIAHLFDAQFNPRADAPAYPPDRPGGTGISIEGSISGVGAGADEARAMLSIFESLGAAPAARDWRPSWVAARLSRREAERVQDAQRRARDPGVLAIHVPVGERAVWSVDSPTILRVGRIPHPRAELPLGFWASTPWLVDALVAQGVPASHVDWLPPFIRQEAPGKGGDGVLAVLPSHDPQASRVVLAALGSVAPQARVRVLPTVASPRIAQLAREHLPGAELLPPHTSEHAFARLAGAADVVVACDPDDGFQRRPLIAAAAGALPITFKHGPVESALGASGLVDSPLDPGVLEQAIRQGLEGPGERLARARRVNAQCGEWAIAARLKEALRRLADRVRGAADAPMNGQR